jgi:hypothetical protein
MFHGWTKLCHDAVAVGHEHDLAPFSEADVFAEFVLENL